MKHGKEPSMDEIIRLANSPAGKELIALLQSNGGDSFEQAKQAAKKGDYELAKQNLSHIMSSPKVQALMKEMENTNG